MDASDLSKVFPKLFQYLRQMQKYEKIIQSHVSGSFSQEEEDLYVRKWRSGTAFNVFRKGAQAVKQFRLASRKYKLK